MSETVRTYRFSPLDRAGWLLGLDGWQCVALGLGLLASAVAIEVGAPVVGILAVFTVALVIAFASWNGTPVRELAPRVVAFTGRRRLGRLRWTAAVPWQRLRHRVAAPVPPLVRGLSIIDIGSVQLVDGVHILGAVVDDSLRTMSATLPVRGLGFSLVERDEQERLLAAWGDVLGSVCVERGPVTSLRVTEWAGPGAAIASRVAEPRVASAGETYESLVRDAGPLHVDHESLVTITVDRRRVRSGSTPEDVLRDAVRSVAARLDAASLSVGRPLDAAELRLAVRRRLDPSATERLRTLAAVGGSFDWSPLVVDERWQSVRVDGSVHRSYWIAEWPRLDVPPNWMEPLVLHGSGIRTLSLHFEPVPPSKARRRIDRDSTRLAADEAHRSRAGFRVGAAHRRAESAVRERESDLVAGFSELEVAGFLTVSATDDDALGRSSAELERVAAQCGVELRPLDARHDLGLLCALPTTRGLARRFAA